VFGGILAGSVVVPKKFAVAPYRDKGTVMTNTEQATRDDGALRLIDSVEDAEQSALEAVRKFLDTVDGVFPADGENGPRRKIIDSAFKMTEQLVGASNQLARRIVKVSEDAFGEYEKNHPTSEKSQPSR
jgi:hypothetical protein